MTAKHVGLNVAHGDSQLLRDKCTETRCIKDAGHTNHALSREAADVKCKLRHCIQRVGDHNHDTIRRVLDDVLSYLCHDLLVFLDQVIPGHPRFARETRSNYNDSRAGGVGIIIGASNQRVIAKHWPRLEHIQGLTLRHVWHNVKHHHVSVVSFDQTLYQRTTDESGANDSYFTAHRTIPFNEK